MLFANSSPLEGQRMEDRDASHLTVRHYGAFAILGGCKREEHVISVLENPNITFSSLAFDSSIAMCLASHMSGAANGPCLRVCISVGYLRSILAAVGVGDRRGRIELNRSDTVVFYPTLHMQCGPLFPMS